MTSSVNVSAAGFEGPEKRLEVCFKINPQNAEGLRTYNKDEWQEVLNHANCTIISVTKNDHFDAYVLSESSLFVFPYKIMIKTCGTTTLLKIIPSLLEYARNCDLSLDLVVYSRKNFLFPSVQPFPHNDWSMEVGYLDEYFDGQSYVLGPLTKDHWYLYVADYSDSADLSSKDITLELMMHKLDRSAALKFYRKEDTDDRDKLPGIADLIPGSETDEFNFTPCGYSMNGLKDDVYWTIHVTPEPHCSYASFETNLSLRNYKELISHVFSIFKPGTVTLTLFTDKFTTAAIAGSSSATPIDKLDLPGYILKHKTVSGMGNRDVIMCNYESLDSAVSSSAPHRIRRPIPSREPRD